MDRNSAVFVGGFLFLCALLFYYCSVLRIDLKNTPYLDLGPYPDAVEYFAQARSISETGRPHIRIGYDILPSRYPPGYPALMVPALKLLPEAKAVLAPFRTNQAIGLLLLCATFATFAYLGKPIFGGCATLLLATLPAFVTYCRSSMSEIGASAFAVTAFVFVYLGLKRQHRWQIYVAAVLLGLSLNIRTQLVFFGPVLIAMALFPVDRSRSRWFLHCAGVLLVFAIAASPVLILNALQFGSPTKTGYDFWVPSAYQSVSPFSFHNMPKHARMLWADFALRPREFGVANLFGTGAYFTPAFVVLIACGFVLLRWTRFTFAAILAGVSFFAITTTYSFVDARFYIPLMILLISVASLPAEWAICQILRGRRVLPAACLVAFFCLACAGYPSQSGYPPERGHWQARDAVQLDRLRGASPAFAAEKAFARIVGRRPAVVLSDIDPVYLNALLPAAIAAAPLDGSHNYQYSAAWRYGKEEAKAIVEGALARDLPVYALFRSVPELESSRARLPTLSGHQWNHLPDSGESAVILTLAPTMPQE